MRAAAAAALAALPLGVLGDERRWNWSYNNNETQVTASGILTTAASSAPGFPIMALSGAWNDVAITGLEPPHSCCSPPGWNDNMLLDGDQKLDKGGFAFRLSDGEKVNLFYKDGRYAYEIQGGAEVFGGAFVVKPAGR
ncbi:MAG TPA: hypothetical protein VEK34_17070 [Methylocella sp.]|nr:hypothetical protein [Methylocella sp.]